MDPKGYYKMLNLSLNCTERQIEDSYCELALKHHPDKNQGDTEKFQAITQAYEVLKDKVKRREYDSGLMFGTSTTIKNTRLIKLSEGILNSLLERHKKEEPQYRSEIVMTLEQIYKGSNRIEKVMMDGRAVLINVTIEPGCPEEHEIRVNKGDTAVVFIVKSKPHHTFRRKGYDLYITKTMTLREYINGFEFIVTLLDGKKKKIAHSYGGTTLEQMKPLKLTGCGMPRGHGGVPGDLYVNIAVKLPHTLKQ